MKLVTTASGGTVNANASGATVGTVSGAAVNVGGANGRVGTLSSGSVAANAAGLVVTNFNGGNIAVSNGVSVGLRSGSSSGAISGAGGVTKSGANTLTLSGVNTYTGTTSVEQGRLVVASGGSLASTNTTVTSSTLTVNGTISGAVTASSGGVVGGSGTVGTLNILGGGVFGPGNSAGTLTSTNAVWSQGGSYDWEIFNLAGPAGTGWDLLQVTAGGELNLTGITTANGFTINLITLSGLTTQGALAGFTPTATYTNWLIASAPTISGFSAGNINLNSSLFVGATGTFGIEQRAYGGGQG
ncbi:MAG: autotransporter-associated beta strand repeat-containing protein, partial [Chthoniobacterales bacterium]